MLSSDRVNKVNVVKVPLTLHLAYTGIARSRCHAEQCQKVSSLGAAVSR